MSTQTTATNQPLADQAQGMVIMASAMLFLPMMDVIGKWLASVDQLSPGQIAFVRFLVQFVVLVPVIMWTMGPSALRAKNVSANLLRGVLLGSASLCFFIAVKYMPVADALAVFFVEPLILTVLSAVILKETVGWRRRIAVVCGFIGALIVVQPSFSLFGPVSLLPLCTALLFSIYLILNRTLSTRDSPAVMQMVAGAGATVVLGLAVIAGATFDLPELAPSMPRYGISWLLLVAIGLMSAGGHLMVVKAFQRAQSSLLAPFQYLEIVSGTIFGLLLFGDFPDPVKWIGIAVIVASGLYTFWRERKIETGGG